MDTKCRGAKLGPVGSHRSIQDSCQWSVVLSSLLFVCATRSHYRRCCWSLLYSAVLRSRADSLRSICDSTQVNIFYSAFLNISQSGVLTALTWLVPHDTAAVSARSVYTIQPCTMSLYAKPHTWGTCVFNCNLPSALLEEWPGSFTCYCGNTAVERIPK